MMSCCKRLLKTEHVNTLPIIQNLQKPYSLFKKVVSKAPTKTSAISDDVADAFWQYINILFMYDVRHYNNFMGMIVRHKEDFHEIYRIIGELETALTVLSFRQSLPAFCLPAFNNENALKVDEIFHPLIHKPVKNSAKIVCDSLLTGSNASGKSTFIKTLAVNGILAQTIYTCTAKHFVTQFAHVITSMAMRDNLLGGESYFIVEIKSLKRILDAVQKFPCICYIDEILRGTNTVERIAASAAVLGWLAERDCLCIAASHDIELRKLSFLRERNNRQSRRF